MASESDLLRALLLVVAVIVLLPMLMMVFAWPMMGLWGGGHMLDGGSGVGAWLLIWLPMILVVLGGTYLLYRAVGGSSKDRSDPALEELRLAYARGDLSDEEFDRRRQRLDRDE